MMIQEANVKNAVIEKGPWHGIPYEV